MHYLPAEYAYTCIIRNKCIKYKNHKRNFTSRPRVSGLQSSNEIKGFIYQVPMPNWQSRLCLVQKLFLGFVSWNKVSLVRPFYHKITNIFIINIILVHIELEDDFILFRNIITQNLFFWFFFHRSSKWVHCCPFIQEIYFNSQLWTKDQLNNFINR